MTPNLKVKIRKFVEEHIPEFHAKRLESLAELKLKRVLKRKNPYLFRAKAMESAGALVDAILAAHLSSQEETIFGAFLEQLAVFTCQQALGGQKSSAEGIDLEFFRDGVRYIVSIKSGPNWGNSQQIARMRDNFKKARKVLGTNQAAVNLVAVNGCCYGQNKEEDQGDYKKLSGQRFWDLISGDAAMYTEIIEPVGYRAKQRNDEFETEFAKVKNLFVAEFIDSFCGADGAIDWNRLVEFNSGAQS